MFKTKLAFVFTSALFLVALAEPCPAQIPELTLEQFIDCVGPNLYNYDEGTEQCQLIPNSTNDGIYIL